MGCGDDEDVPDPGEHQRRQRVVDHRLVVDRDELLRDSQCDRMQSRTRTARQNDAFMIPLVKTSMSMVASQKGRPSPAVRRPPQVVHPTLPGPLVAGREDAVTPAVPSSARALPKPVLVRSSPEVHSWLVESEGGARCLSLGAHRAEQSVPAWERSHARGEVPSVWPYGLDALRDHAARGGGRSPAARSGRSCASAAGHRTSRPSRAWP